MVFQDEQLFTHLDVAANVAFGLRMRGDGRPRQRRTRRASCSRSSGWPASSTASVVDLSGGEAQAGRARPVARAVARVCSCSTSRSPGSTASCTTASLADLGGILRAERTTSVLVTHDVDEAEAIADRTILLAELAA